MYTISAVYDGEKFAPTQPVNFKKSQRVMMYVVEAPVKPLGGEKKPLSELRGILKGKVWMSDDFGEPLDEMKEYMY